MRARNVGKICRGPSGRSAGGNDEQKRWEEARRLEEGTRDLPSRDPEVCRAGTSRTLAWELGAQPRPNRKNIAELKGRTISVYVAQKDNGEAREALEAGRAIMTRLVALSPDNAGWKKDLAWFDRQLAALKR